MEKHTKVREPVQVYLDDTDRGLLEDLAGHTGLSRAELLRRGIRTLADGLLSGGPRGGSLNVLIGALGNDEDLPHDLAEHHDRYLYGSGPD